MPAMRGLFTALSPAGERGRLSILIFHRVLAKPDPLMPEEPDAARFDQLCAWLKGWFNVLPLDRAVAQLAARTLPARALAITFDDGYADNHDVALPILTRHGLSATFFIASGFLDGGRMWNDGVIEAVRRTPLGLLDLRGAQSVVLDAYSVKSAAEKRLAIAAIIDRIKYLAPRQRDETVAYLAAVAGVSLPDDLMMRGEQVVGLRRAGMLVGAHTVHHPILAELDIGSARDEIARGKQQLERLIGEPVRLFAYPNGRPDRDYTPATIELVRGAGFEAALTTAPGAAATGCDLFQIPRFTPWDRRRMKFGLRMAQTLWTSRKGSITAARAD